MKSRIPVWTLWGAICLLAVGAGLPAAPPATAPAVPATVLPHIPQGLNVAIITIDGEIDDYTAQTVRNCIERANAAGAGLIVFEMNTPGGEIYPAIKISQDIKQVHVPTVAWVHNDAFSAGSLISAACQTIIVSSASHIGDCAPIQIARDPTTGRRALVPLPDTERAKFLAPLDAEFRDSAARNNYDMAIFQAMTRLGVDLYLVKNNDTGQTHIVNQLDKAVMVDGEPMPTPEQIAAAKGLTPAFATSGEQGKWSVVKSIHSGTDLLTFTQTEALDAGLAAGTADNDAQVQALLAAKGTVRITPSWLFHMAYFLSIPMVRALLVIVMMIGAYFELHAPGTALGGSIALGAAVLLFGPPYLMGLASIWPVLMFAVGLGILVVELFVTPTFGVLGVVGMVCMFAGIVLAGIPNGGGLWDLPTSTMAAQLQAGILWALAAVGVSLVAFVFLAKHFGSIPILGKMILAEAHGRHRAPAGTGPAVSGQEVFGGGQVKPGSTGAAVSSLRPSGRAQIGDQVIDVVTLGDWIERGSPVRVVEVQGGRIVVEQAEG